MVLGVVVGDAIGRVVLVLDLGLVLVMKQVLLLLWRRAARSKGLAVVVGGVVDIVVVVLTAVKAIEMESFSWVSSVETETSRPRLF